MRFRSLGTILALSALASSCGGGSTGVSDTNPKPPVVITAAVATTTVTIANASLNPGQSTQLSVVTRDASGNVLSGRVIAFTTSNNAVATVSSSGQVSAVGAGSATITATSEGVSGSATVTVSLAAIGSVTISSSATSLLAGQTAQLTINIRDAAGNTLNGRAVAYSSSNNSVATVSASGLVTTVVAGTSTITATSEGVMGTLTIVVIDPRIIPIFDRPFAGDFQIGNFMDHDIPKEFVDANGNFVTFWGESHPGLSLMTDGHSGYDFLMPVGTPLLAVAAGTVVIASTSSAPFFCPPLNRNVTDQADVYIEHKLIGGITIQSRYSHISRIDVTVGQQVVAGQQIALSGNTGCTTAAHLHFQVDRMTQTATGARTEIDPYGWTGAGRDPWELSPIGATSIQLWKSGQAPALFRQITLALAPTGIAPLAITKVVFEGVNDAANPNNEYVEITLDTRVAASASLSGYTLRGDASGLNFAFPSSVTLTTAQPVLRVYTGSGTNSATAIYMGRPSGVWSNLFNNDCVRLVNAGGGQYRANLGNSCPLP